MTTQSPKETSTRANSPIPVITNHCEYYLPGGDRFIKVDNTLFHVHTYFFIWESTIWQNILGMNRWGRTATNPIELGMHILCVRGHFLSSTKPASPTTSDHPPSLIIKSSTHPTPLFNNNPFPTCFNSNSRRRHRLSSDSRWLTYWLPNPR